MHVKRTLKFPALPVLALLINATSHWGDGKHGLFLKRYLPRLSVTLCFDCHEDGWKRAIVSCRTHSQTRFIEQDGKWYKCSSHGVYPPQSNFHTSFWFYLTLSFSFTSHSVCDNIGYSEAKGSCGKRHFLLYFYSKNTT